MCLEDARESWGCTSDGFTMPNNWCTIARISYFDPTIGPIDVWDNLNSSNKSFDMGNNIHISPSPDWFLEPVFIECLSDSEKKEVHLTKYVFMIECEDDSLGGSKQVEALEKIRMANLALWISRPSSLGFDLVVHADKPGNAWILRQISRPASLKVHPQDQETRLTSSDIETARKIFLALSEVGKSGAIWIAAKTLWKGLKEQEWEFRHILLWIALEALFGSSDPKEITYRLSNRIAFFLASNRSEAKPIFHSAKNGYMWRSKFVHGMKVKDIENWESILSEAEQLVRKALNRILIDSNLILKFNNEEKRETYLDDILFS